MTTPYIQDSELNTLVSKSGIIVADFTAAWCGPCKLVAPVIDRLQEDYVDKAQVFKVDIDENQENTKKYGIRSIPCVLVFKDGEVVERLLGKHDYNVYSEAIDKHL